MMERREMLLCVEFQHWFSDSHCEHKCEDCHRTPGAGRSGDCVCCWSVSWEADLALGETLEQGSCSL